MQSVAVAKPDGYTLLITVPSLHTLPEVDKLFGRPATFTRDQFVPIEANRSPQYSENVPGRRLKMLCADSSN